jgi:hypothetical protein
MHRYLPKILVALALLYALSARATDSMFALAKELCTFNYANNVSHDCLVWVFSSDPKTLGGISKRAEKYRNCSNASQRQYGTDGAARDACLAAKK